MIQHDCCMSSTTKVNERFFKLQQGKIKRFTMKKNTIRIHILIVFLGYVMQHDALTIRILDPVRKLGCVPAH